MRRSASTNRVPDDDDLKKQNSSSKVSRALRALSLEANKLPSFEPLSDVAKKEQFRLRFAENAVHLIPFVLFLCAFTLWFLSNSDVDVSRQRELIAAKTEGSTLLQGETDTDRTRTGFLAAGIGVEDLDISKQDRDRNTSHSEMKSSFISPFDV